MSQGDREFSRCGRRGRPHFNSPAEPANPAEEGLLEFRRPEPGAYVIQPVVRRRPETFVDQSAKPFPVSRRSRDDSDDINGSADHPTMGHTGSLQRRIDGLLSPRIGHLCKICPDVGSQIIAIVRKLQRHVSAFVSPPIARHCPRGGGRSRGFAKAADFTMRHTRPASPPSLCQRPSAITQQQLTDAVSVADSSQVAFSSDSATVESDAERKARSWNWRTPQRQPNRILAIDQVAGQSESLRSRACAVQKIRPH